MIAHVRGANKPPRLVARCTVIVLQEPKVERYMAEVLLEYSD